MKCRQEMTVSKNSVSQGGRGHSPVLVGPFFELVMGSLGGDQVQVADQRQRGRSRRKSLGSSANIAKAVDDDSEEQRGDGQDIRDHVFGLERSLGPNLDAERGDGLFFKRESPPPTSSGTTLLCSFSSYKSGADCMRFHHLILSGVCFSRALPPLFVRPWPGCEDHWSFYALEAVLCGGSSVRIPLKSMQSDTQVCWRCHRHASHANVHAEWTLPFLDTAGA